MDTVSFWNLRGNQCWYVADYLASSYFMLHMVTVLTALTYHLCVVHWMCCYGWRLQISERAITYPCLSFSGSLDSVWLDFDCRWIAHNIPVQQIRLKLESLRWRHNGRDSVSNHQPYDWLLNRLFRRRWKKTSKLRVTGLCGGNLPGTGEFPTQMASNADNVSIWWRHHVHHARREYVWLPINRDF